MPGECWKSGYVARVPGLAAVGKRSHLPGMNLDLSDEETAALTDELHNIVENDRYPFSPRIRTLRAILGKAHVGAGARAFAAAETLRTPRGRRATATVTLRSV